MAHPNLKGGVDKKPITQGVVLEPGEKVRGVEAEAFANHHGILVGVYSLPRPHACGPAMLLVGGGIIMKRYEVGGIDASCR